MSFVKISSVKDLQDNKMIGITVDGKEILVAKLGSKYYAIGNKCAHRGCKLSNGTLIREEVECPCHGSIFDIKTGRLIKGPAKKSEPVFKTKIEGGEILVEA